MADDAAGTTDDTQITFNIKAANDQKHVLTLPAATTVADLKDKLSTSEYANIPADRQRLIYSGRVLKDHDTLRAVKMKDGHTIHLVKGAASNARQNPANQGTSTAGGAAATPQVPTNLAAGPGNNPLAGLTGARYAGFHSLPSADMFGADGGMGPPPNPEQLLELMEDPNFLQQMNEAMNNPAVIEMMQNSPMVRDNPIAQEMLRNPEMRRMMFNPEMMRMQIQMQRAMGGNGFPMPGATDTTPGNANNTPNSTGSTQAQDPFAGLFGSGSGVNPLAGLMGGAGGANPFAPAATGTGTNAAAPGSTPSADGTQNTPTSQPTPNPFAGLFGPPPTGDQQNNPVAEMTRSMMQNPDALRSVMQMMNSMQGGNAGAFPPGTFGQPPTNATGTTSPSTTNPFAALFGPGSSFGTGAPSDSRPPEEIYELQLRQLNEMGFYEFDRNVAALRRSGGNVQGAIEHLLNGGS